MLMDRCLKSFLRVGILTTVAILAASPTLADTQTQGQSCDFGNTTVTVGDVVTAANLSITQGGQSMIDAAGVKVAKKTPVPEPGSLAIFSVGLLMLFRARPKA